MFKVKVKGVPFTLKGEPIKKGQVLEFKAQKLDGSDFDIKQVQGMKIISFFPDIETSICDKQTREIVEFAKRSPDTLFLSISCDSIAKQAKWCLANGYKNIDIVSDLKYGEFGDKTNLFVNRLKELPRGFLLLDKSNKVVDLSINEELTVDPDFEKMATWVVEHC